MQTPGSLRVLVDGREVTGCLKRTYAATAATPSKAEIDGGCYEQFLPGDLDKPSNNADLLITVEPAHATGDWTVRIF